MKRAVLIVMAGLAVAALGAGAVAQKGAKPMGWAEPQKRVEAEAKARAYFARIDANRDGVATRQEFGAARETRFAEIRGNAFDRMDRDRNGQISRSEFEAGGGRQGGAAARGGGRRFDRIDTNSNGSVTQAEMLASVMARFDANDTNKDGVVTVEERRAAWGNRFRRR